MTSCPECGSIDIVTDTVTKEEICHGCGLVVSDRKVDAGPEWRAYDNESRQSRTRVGAGETLTLHDKGLPTIIGKENYDAHGRQLSTSNRAQVFRLRKWQKRTRVSGRDRSLTEGLNLLLINSERLTLPKATTERSIVIFRKALTKGVVRGRSIVLVVGASIYLACRENKILRSLDEVTDAVSVDKKAMSRVYRFLLKANASGEQTVAVSPPPASVIGYVSRFGDTLNVPVDRQGEAIRVFRMLKQTGQGPLGLAASVLYVVCSCEEYLQARGMKPFMYSKNNPLTQEMIASVCGVTEVTIRNRYKEILKYLKKTGALTVPMEAKANA